MPYSSNYKSKILFGLIASFITAFYLLMSLHNSINTPIVSDTYQYIVIFQNIHNNPFPFGIEFITPTIMWLVNTIGGGFYSFLFVCYVLWAPIVFLLVIKSKNNLLLIPILLFFFSPLFTSNVTLLIRQYNAAFFFIMYLYSLNNYRKKYITATFLLLSICSHLSAIIWLFFLSKRLARIIYKPLVLIALFVVAIIFILLHINIISSFIELLSTIGGYLDLEALNRKVAFYTSGEYLQAQAVNFKFIIVMLTLMLFSIFWSLRIKHRNTQLFLGWVFIQAFIVILLQNNTVMANRFGFFAYYFAVPLLILVIPYGFKKIRIGLT